MPPKAGGFSSKRRREFARAQFCGDQGEDTDSGRSKRTHWRGDGGIWGEMCFQVVGWFV
jgi:hypothetical protein